MAIEAVNDVIRHLKLRGHGLHNVQTLKLVLTGIANCGGEPVGGDGHTGGVYTGWPGYAYLADAGDCDEKTAKRAIPVLAALGLIRVGFREGPRGANVYRFTLPFTPDWAAFEQWRQENPKEAEEATRGSLPPPDPGQPDTGDAVATGDSSGAPLGTVTPPLGTEAASTRDTQVSPEAGTQEPEPSEPARATPPQPGRDGKLVLDNSTANNLTAKLKELLPVDDFAAWGQRLQLVSVSPSLVVVTGAPNAFFKSRIQKQFRQPVIAAVQSLPEHASLPPTAAVGVRIRLNQGVA